MKAKRSLVYLCSTVGFLSSWAFGISRIGNSLIGSDETGFETAIPADFDVALEFAASGSSPDAPLVLQDRRSTTRLQVFVLANNFKSMYPNADLQIPSDLPLALRSIAPGSTWRAVPSSSLCARSYITITNEHQALGVSLWGPNTGVVFAGSFNPRSYKAIRDMLKTLTLKEGACLWD